MVSPSMPISNAIKNEMRKKIKQKIESQQFSFEHKMYEFILQIQHTHTIANQILFILCSKTKTNQREKKKNNFEP